MSFFASFCEFIIIIFQNLLEKPSFLRNLENDRLNCKKRRQIHNFSEIYRETGLFFFEFFERCLFFLRKPQNLRKNPIKLEEIDKEFPEKEDSEKDFVMKEIPDQDEEILRGIFLIFL